MADIYLLYRSGKGGELVGAFRSQAGAVRAIATITADKHGRPQYSAGRHSRYTWLYNDERKRGQFMVKALPLE